MENTDGVNVRPSDAQFLDDAPHPSPQPRPDHLPPDWGQRIRQIRSQHRLSQRELADIIHSKATTIYRWEKGTTPPPAPKWKAILAVEKQPTGMLKTPLQPRGRGRPRIHPAREPVMPSREVIREVPSEMAPDPAVIQFFCRSIIAQATQLLALVVDYQRVVERKR